MNKRFFRNILILLITSALLFAAFRYIFYLKDNIRELESQKQNLLLELEKERNTVEKLKLKNNSLIVNLQATHKRLGKSFLDLKSSGEKFEEVNSRAALLKTENVALIEDKIKLTKENEVFKSALTSIPELKGIIRELKRLARSSGNRGYLVRSGESTATSKVKIEVVPAPVK